MNKTLPVYNIEASMETLTYIIGLFPNVDSTGGKIFLSAFSACIGGLIAAILTNRGHDRRLKLQLGHDKNMKDRDREMALRKEVYLSAVEALSVGLTAIVRHNDIEVDHGKILEDYVSKSPALGKIHVVAREETIGAILSLSCELDAVFLRLLPKRFSLIRQKMEIVVLKQQFETHQKEQSRILELMKQYNLDGSRDQQKWELFQENFNRESKSAEEILKKGEELTTALFIEQTRFSEECCNEKMRLGCLLSPVVVAFRKELDLPIDDKEYMRLMQEIATQQNERMKIFSEEIKAFWSSEIRPWFYCERKDS